MYRIFFKRLLDLILSLLGLMLFLPLFLILMLSLSVVNKGAPFFFQKRPGKHGKIFTIIKFKTMTDEVDAKGELLPDFERMTRIGSFVRKYSLDEIPQLISVLIGDMSLIGPRPLLERYLPLYSKEQARRHDVKPGVTGWAQVNGRNSISWQEKFKLDVYYVDNISFVLDVKIIFMTIAKVFKSEGVNNSETDTMAAFTGNSN
ncbi:sugar transferase [Muricauda sp. 2012CJ35-5]|uniref:Sugar transferase n=1 Tax=Flagellimonas spongiicola TaxID=2942208 RepID=A0ABT0PW76_9FLAO|nr:sugar transferase [Allomuricauda spongiicola]MCL6275536.1 sugar transferase [Allomuricauda spongiicola]